MLFIQPMLNAKKLVFNAPQMVKYVSIFKVHALLIVQTYLVNKLIVLNLVFGLELLVEMYNVKTFSGAQMIIVVKSFPLAQVMAQSALQRKAV